MAEIANDYLRIPTLDAALADASDWMSSNPIKALDVDRENVWPTERVKIVSH